MVLERRNSDGWTTTALTGDQKLQLRAPDLEIPVSEFYRGVDLPRV